MPTSWGREMRVRRQSPVLWLCLVFLFFTGGILGFGWWLDGRSVASPVIAFASMAAAALAVLLAAVLQIVRLTMLKPAKRLAVEARAIIHGGQGRPIDWARYAALPELAEAVAELGKTLDGARGQVAEAVATATASTETEKARLAAILNDLHEGVVICNLKHQVVLYNQIALSLLQVVGEMGLGRPLSGLLALEPVVHILELLLHRSDGGPRTAPFITGTPGGRSLLEGRMSLVRAQSGVTGYVITFNDVTEQVSALAKRDGLLRELIERLRGPAERLAKGEGDLEALGGEVTQAFERATKGYRSLLAGWWPMSDIHTGYLFEFVIRRLADSGLKVNLTGLPLWIHGDGHSLVLAFEVLVRSIAKGTGAAEFDLAAEAEGGHVWVCISWRGRRVDDESLIDWQKAMILPAMGSMTVRDVMQHHTREDLVEEANGDVITLRLALPLGREGHDRAFASETLPPRPEFFDFNLLAQGQAGELRQVPLRDLTYVVFDTETTGLHPTQGDAIVSLAGVRIVNGRILTGETFSRVVHPGRSIPAESVKFHGITDAMVVDKPPLPVVLPQFKAYVADAVLVAHNAAFDLKFIRMREQECGVRFDNPVLDTMLLSSFLDGTTERQSLDAIAERYGVTVTDRHTALGDSLVTAAILLRLFDALEAKGIRTLDDAMTTLDMVMDLHNRTQALM